MSNKIDGLSGTRTAQSVVEIATNRSQKTRENGETAASAPIDRVSLTDTAGDLRALAKALAEAPSVDSSRVDAVKQAISDGSFRIDARRIAQNLLQMDADLIK